MKTTRYFSANLSCFVFVLLIADTTLVVAQEDAEANPCAAAELEEETSQTTAISSLNELVSGLDSDRFLQRESASRQLLNAGAPAVSLLSEAMDGGSAELFWRGFAVLRQATDSPDVATRRASIDSLRSLSESSDARISTQAKFLLENGLASHHEWAVARLNELGAGISTRSKNVSTISLNSKWTGGNDGLAFLSDVKGVESIQLQNPNITDDGLVHLVGIKALKRLYLGKSGVTGHGLSQLAALPNLTYLSLKELKVGGNQLNALQHLKNLTQLGLDETLTTDENLRLLKGMTKLETLWLNHSQITDDGLFHLRGMRSLNKLILTGNKITGPGLAHLAEIPSLRYISLQHVALDDDAMVHIGKLSQIDTLGLDDTQVGDGGSHYLKQLTSLKTLWLVNTNVSDASVESLSKLGQLENLYLKDSAMTEEGLKQVVEALPNCSVQH